MVINGESFWSEYLDEEVMFGGEKTTLYEQLRNLFLSLHVTMVQQLRVEQVNFPDSPKTSSPMKPNRESLSARCFIKIL